MLRNLGHDVLYVAEFAASLSDTEVMELASNDRRLLPTADKDFGEYVFRHSKPVPGLVLVRIDPEKKQLVGARLAGTVDEFGERLSGRYIVVEEMRFRSRPL